MMNIVEERPNRQRWPKPEPVIEPGAMSVKNACIYLGMSLTRIYEEMGNGKLKYRKNGKRTVILKFEADEYLAALPSGTGLSNWGGPSRKKVKPEPAE